MRQAWGFRTFFAPTYVLIQQYVKPKCVRQFVAVVRTINRVWIRN